MADPAFDFTIERHIGSDFDGKTWVQDTRLELTPQNVHRYQALTIRHELWYVETNATGQQACDVRNTFAWGHDHLASTLLDFFADRLKVQQREAGVRHDLIDAVFALGGEDDLVRLLARVRALQAFVETPEGADLLAGYKRAANILKKEGWPPTRHPGGGRDPCTRSRRTRRGFANLRVHGSRLPPG